MKAIYTLLILLTIVTSGIAADQVVTNNNDTGAGSLRQAIADVGDGETITFNIPSSDIITIASELSISGKGMTINGTNLATGNPVTVQVTAPGTSTFRVFYQNVANKTINISNMIIKGGNVGSGWGGSINMVEGSLSLNRVTIQGSKALYGGGICAVKGPTSPMSLTITNSTIDACESTNNGGGICGNGIAILLSNSTFKGNSTLANGGAIATGNTTDFDITNCTFFNNTATYYGGGFCMLDGNCSLSNCTFSNNSSPNNQGGGVGLWSSWGALTFKNCILVNNTGYDYYYGAGALTDNGYNVVESQNTTVAGKGFQSTNNLLNTDPTGLASSLSYEGGYTEVLKVTAGNILSNPGSTTETTDQRGYYRKSGTIYYGTTPTSNTNYITRGAYQYYGIIARTNTVDNWTSASNNYYTDLQGAENHVSAGATVKLAGTSILLSEVDISQSITLTGEGTESTTLRVAEPGITNSRVFNINAPGSTINISNMTIQGGDISGIFNDNNGGAIYLIGNTETTVTTLNLNYVTVSDSKATTGGGIYGVSNVCLDISNSTISGNTATNLGGGLYFPDDCNIENSTISGNTAGGNGGGIYQNRNSDQNDNLTITNSVISGNSSSADGGGLYNTGMNCTITNSTISANTSTNRGGGVANTELCTITKSTINGNTANTHGGGIWSNDECTIINTTIYDNTANSSLYGGGGLLNSGTFSIINSSISGNNAPNKYGGGVYNYSTSLTVKNSMIAANTASSTGDDFYYRDGTVTDNGYNIVENSSGYTWSGTGDITGDQANLFGTGLTSQTLADNGGPTQTLAIESGSVAIGAGTGDATVTTDQRGYFRSDTPTIGAYEYNGSNTITWDGSLNTNWNTTDNWDCETVPTSSYNVIIPGSLSNYPVIASGTGASTNDLTVNNGASLSLNSGGSLITYGTVSGSVDVNMDITVGTWHFISAPVAGALSGMFEESYLQNWNESLQEWQDITSKTVPLTAVKGFSLWYETSAKPAGTTFTFSGIPHTGDQSINLSYSGKGDPNGNIGANLVGNPYPSYIDWDQISGYGSKYTWDGWAYKAYTQTGSYGEGSRYVAPMEGFFVVTGSSGNTFMLTNDMRTHNSAKKEANALSNGIILSASSENYSDALYIVFDAAANENFELPRDAWKFISGTAGICQIWSKCPDGNLAVDVRPETESIQLGFTNNEAGTYSIGIKEIADLSTAILEDTKLNIFHDLTQGAYTFDWSLTDDETRFKLHLNTTAVEEINGSAVHAYVVGSNIIVQSESPALRVILTDIAGRTLGVWGNVENIPAPQTDGVYLVTVETGNQRITKKIIVE